MRWCQLLLDLWRKENRGIWQIVILSSFHIDFLYTVYLFFQSRWDCPGFCLRHPVTLHSSHLICYCAQSFSHVWPFVTPWTIACQVPLSMRLSWQEYWNGLPFPPPGHLPGPGTEYESLYLLHWQVDSFPLHHLGSPYALLVSPYFKYMNEERALLWDNCCYWISSPFLCHRCFWKLDETYSYLLRIIVSNMHKTKYLRFLWKLIGTVYSPLIPDW